MVPRSDVPPAGAGEQEAEIPRVIPARRPAPFARVADPRFVVVRCGSPGGRRPSVPGLLPDRREPLR